MTAPIWMASPPELHSALLSSGPGPGPLLAAAGAWSQLSAEYSSAAEELSALLAGVQAGSWQGPSGESYAVAHAPYLAWLTKASADSAAAASQHELAAAAYTAALAAMPTLPELATNHAVHGALLATNFFGINTIPIAINEADYARMWTQAATTMTTYQAVSTAAVAATPAADPAPPIMKADDSGTDPGVDDTDDFPDPTVDNPLNNFIAQILRLFGINWNPAQGTVNGLPYDSYANPGNLMFWVVRALELLEDFEQYGVYLQQNPALAFQYLVALETSDWPTHIAEITSWLSSSPQLLLIPALVAIAPLGAVGGLAGLAGLAAVPHPVIAPAPPAPPAPALPAAAPPPAPTPIGAPAAAPASAPAPAPAPTATTVASPAPPPAPPPPGPGFVPPYFIAPPGVGSRTGIGASASSSAKRKAPEPDAAAAAAAASAREAAAARRRKRQRKGQRGYGDEFMDMNVDVDPDWGAPPSAETLASDRGADNLGFTGTARKAAGGAAGLATLDADEFGGGPTMPMVPGTWDSDGAPGEGDETSNG
ncbi:PPE domain-containing protein [Mycobacterium avium]|uniref:PPE domain-containing protein n=1 Tax=Mycobacterium avium TaxID=1764 RepID=UPI000CE425EA|nr:PPE domain-containing protein [Mycobacterium avium]